MMKKRATRHSSTTTCIEPASPTDHKEKIVPEHKSPGPSQPKKTMAKTCLSDEAEPTQRVKKRARTENENEPPVRRAQTPPLMDTAIERARNVDKVLYGIYEIGAWYYSPYPSEFGAFLDRLYICEHCLNYTNKEAQLKIHKMTCKKRRLPGKVIYQDGTLKIYEVDGREQKLFCQNLCLMAKLFVDHKTLYYDTEGFKFYILTEQIKQSDIMVGYFSKEKLSYDNYNLACIMVLPTHQRKGYGRLLIELSYELSKKEGVVGSPEKPLSSLGALGYKSYWASTLVAFLSEFCGQLSISDISKKTCIHEEDIISTLTQLGLLTYSKKITLHTPAPHIDDHTGAGVVQTLSICITKDMLEKAIQTHRISLNRKLLPQGIRF